MGTDRLHALPDRLVHLESFIIVFRANHCPAFAWFIELANTILQPMYVPIEVIDIHFSLYCPSRSFGFGSGLPFYDLGERLG